jgi:hypothetical protein
LTRRDESDVDSLGRRLVWLAANHGTPDDVIDCARRIQVHVLTRTREHLRQGGWLLPEYLVAGRVIEQAILTGLSRPTTRFSVLLEEQLPVAVEYMRLRGLLVDRWILQERGVPLRRQALLASIAEASFGMDLRGRQVIYLWLMDGLPVSEIGPALGIEEASVRSILTTALWASRSKIRPRLEAWESPRIAKSPRRAPRRRRSRRSAP